MPKIHTHYDNLKVMRDAPPEVIRAAYKTLSQKFHPDRNLSDQTATRTFQHIARAYEVLSNPEKRKQHDDWIAATEAELNAMSAVFNPAKSRSNRVRFRRKRPILVAIWTNWKFLILVALTGLGLLYLLMLRAQWF